MTITPGPWHPMRDRDGDIRGITGGDNGRNVVNWNGISRPSKVEGKANAMLICRAPELVSMLQRLVAVGQSVVDARTSEAADQLESALEECRNLLREL